MKYTLILLMPKNKKYSNGCAIEVFMRKSLLIKIYES